MSLDKSPYKKNSPTAALSNPRPPKVIKRVILFELNEISDLVINKLIDSGKLPTFARINSDWSFHPTTSEREYHLIEPWIQWVSVHTGKTFAEHKIFHLGDQHQLKEPQIWETLSANLIPSCVISALNSSRGSMQHGIFVPDPWATRDETIPRSLAPLWQLLSKKIKGHATAGRISINDLLRGGLVCLKLKLPLTMYFKCGVEFLQAATSKKKHWMLAAVLDRLLSEVFLRAIELAQPKFGALLLNSVAHFQHHYWRNFDRTVFNAAVQSPDCEPSDDPVTYGYQMMDQRLQRMISKLDDGETAFIIASGLSQEPYLHDEDHGGMNYYRLKSHQQFVDTLNLQNVEVYPLMSRDWRIESVTPQSIEIAAQRLAQLTVEGQPLFRTEVKLSPAGKSQLFLETAVTRAVSPYAKITGVAGEEIGTFGDLFTVIAVKSGHHTGRGNAWFSEPLAGITPGTEIPVTAIHTIVLNALLNSSSAKVRALPTDGFNTVAQPHAAG